MARTKQTARLSSGGRAPARSFARDSKTCDAFHAAALSPEQRSYPFARIDDLPLSICLSFLSEQQRYRRAADVSRQWNRVAALPTSNASSIIRLQHHLSDAVTPTHGLLRWASQRAAGASSSSASFPLLPSPHFVPCGKGTEHPSASTSINCLIAAHLGGTPSHGSVNRSLTSKAPAAVGPNPPYLSELLGWPNLAAAARDGSRHSYIRAETLKRRVSFEAWARMSSAHLHSLTIRSPVQEEPDAVVPGGDEEWIELLRCAAPELAAASATVTAPRGSERGRMDFDDAQEERVFRRAIAAGIAAASAKAAKLQFDPADSPFPRLRSLTIEGSALSWPVVHALLRACPSIIHLSVPTDTSAECKAACAELKTRGPDASVNDVLLSESRCSLCHEQSAPLLLCENQACKLRACGPCMMATDDRHHFLCYSVNRHEGGSMLYCYARGPCDDHVYFACEDCISAGAGDSSPGECGACGCLACCDHHAYGECDHYPEVMYRCSRCRCRKCRYCCNEFSADEASDGEEGDEASDDDDDEEESEDGEGDEGEDKASGAAQTTVKKKTKKKTKEVTYWRHG